MENLSRKEEKQQLVYGKFSQPIDLGMILKVWELSLKGVGQEKCLQNTKLTYHHCLKNPHTRMKVLIALQVLSQSISNILRPVAKPMTFEKRSDGSPMVVLVSGVNGVGKTTTIGKIAHELHHKEGKKIMLAAGDTFRAAAVEQLNIWADRSNSSFYGKDIGADAASVAYEAYEKAVAENVDVLFIDTAGRLHNKTNLMAELEKIVRVLKKKDENLPHEVLLILDSTTGQNAHDQLKTFKEMVNVTGLAVTKLDGSAKGGVVVSLADQFEMPICLIGVGEQIGDLQPFDPDDFAKSLVGLA